MSLFSIGLVPDATTREIAELRAYLDVVVREHLDAVTRMWTHHPTFGVTAEERFQLKYDAALLTSSLRRAAVTAESIEKAILAIEDKP